MPALLRSLVRRGLVQLAKIDCDYEMTAFDLDETCRGALESK